MKVRSRFLLGTTLFLLSVPNPARAHFKMNPPSPAEWIATNADGDPQKTRPCGIAGNGNGMVTTVKAGSKLPLRWTETTGHPGHYRISLAADRSQLQDPAVMGARCGSAAIQATPVLPVIADGLFPHAMAAEGKVYDYEITVPNMPCEKCTLQVVQFMSNHATPCFYYHCMDLKIVPGDSAPPDAGADATVVDMGGGVVDAATGAGGSGAGGSGAGGATGSGGSGAGGAVAGKGGTSGGTGGRAGKGGTSGGMGGAGEEEEPVTAKEGCSVGGGPTAATVPAAGLLLATALFLRSRRRRR